MAQKRKIGELQTKAARIVIFYEGGSRNPYRIARKWYDCGWHTKTEERYGDLLSVTIWINNFVLKETGYSGIFTTEIF